MADSVNEMHGSYSLGIQKQNNVYINQKSSSFDRSSLLCFLNELFNLSEPRCPHLTDADNNNA